MSEPGPDDLWADLNPLAELQRQSDGQLSDVWFDVGGYFFGDSFDTILRELSLEYLRSAWDRLHYILRSNGIEPNDLSWGWLFTGDSLSVPNGQAAPSDFTGWITQDLDLFAFNVNGPLTQRFELISNELKAGKPVLRCAYQWRRCRKWRIAPDDFPLAARLIEALWTEDFVDWAPRTILGEHERITALALAAQQAYADGDRIRGEQLLAQLQAIPDQPEYWLPDAIPASEPWRQVALAIATGSQAHLERALHEASAVYSPLGYRILTRGFKRYLSQTMGTVRVYVP